MSKQILFKYNSINLVVKSLLSSFNPATLSICLGFPQTTTLEHNSTVSK